MKLLSALCLLPTLALAEFEKWTDTSGRTAEMEIQSVTKTGDATTVQFRLKNGTIITLDASKLSDADIKRLTEWKSHQPDTATFVSASSSESFPTDNPRDPFSHGSIADIFKLFSTFYFRLPSPTYCGIKRDSLTTVSSKITDCTKILTQEDTAKSHSPSDIKSSKYWQLDNDNQDTRIGNFDGTLTPFEERLKRQPGVYIKINYKNDDIIHLADLEKTSLHAEITAVKSEGLAKGEITFTKADIGQRNENHSTSPVWHDFSIFRLALQEHSPALLSKDPKADYQDLGLESTSPYLPSGIESWELYSEDQPIKKLSEVTGSTITVKFKYWSVIHECKVICEKTAMHD